MSPESAWELDGLGVGAARRDAAVDHASTRPGGICPGYFTPPRDFPINQDRAWLGGDRSASTDRDEREHDADGGYGGHAETRPEESPAERGVVAAGSREPRYDEAQDGGRNGDPEGVAEVARRLQHARRHATKVVGQASHDDRVVHREQHAGAETGEEPDGEHRGV